MRTRSELDLRLNISGGRINDMPVRPFEGRDVEYFAVRRDGHPVRATFVDLFPHLLFSHQIKAGQALRGADVELAGPGTGGYALHVLRRLARRHIPGRNPLDESVSGANVVDQDSHAAIFHIVADAWNGNVEEMLFSIGSPQLSRFRKNRGSEQTQQANDDSALSHLFPSEETIMPVELSVVDDNPCKPTYRKGLLLSSR